MATTEVPSSTDSTLTTVPQGSGTGNGSGGGGGGGDAAFITVTTADLGSPTDPGTFSASAMVDDGSALSMTVQNTTGVQRWISTLTYRRSVDLVSLFPLIDFTLPHKVEWRITPTVYGGIQNFIGVAAGDTETNVLGGFAYERSDGIWRAGNFASSGWTESNGGQTDLATAGACSVDMYLAPSNYLSMIPYWYQDGINDSQPLVLSFSGFAFPASLPVYTVHWGTANPSDQGVLTLAAQIAVRVTSLDPAA